MLDHAALSGKVQSQFYTQTIASGHYYGLILLSSETPIDLEQGRGVVSLIENFLTQSPAPPPNEIITQVKQSLLPELSLSIVLTQVEGRHLIISKLGQVGAKLIRAKKIVSLLDFNDQEQKELHGPLEKNDLLILGTKAFFDLVVLTTLAEGNNASAVEQRDGLLALVESATTPEPVSALFVNYNEPAEITTEPEAAPPERVVSQDILVTKPLWSQRLLREFSPHHLLRSFSDPTAPRSVRKPLYLALIVLVTLMSLLAFQLRSRASESSAQLIANLTTEVDTSIVSAKNLGELNQLAARNALLTQKLNLEQQTKGLGPTEQKAVNLLIAKLDDQIRQVSKIHSVASLTTFYDFALLRNGPGIVSANLHDGKVVALDAKNGAVYSLTTDTKNAVIVGGTEELKSAQLVDFSPTSVYVLGNTGIYTKLFKDEGPLKKIIPASSDWGSIKSMVTFAGNLYLLDSDKNEIWKYQGSETGFSDLTSYLVKGLSLNLSKTNSLGIDGSVYVLSQSGTLVKFSGGSPEDFSFIGLPTELKNPSHLFVTDGTENLYFLDDNSSRVWVVTKKGTYVAQYVLPDKKNLVVRSLLVDEKVKKVFLVSESKIFSFDLR